MAEFLEKRVRDLEVEVAVLRAKMNLIAYLSALTFSAVVVTLISVLMK